MSLKVDDDDDDADDNEVRTFPGPHAVCQTPAFGRVSGGWSVANLRTHMFGWASNERPKMTPGPCQMTF